MISMEIASWVRLRTPASRPETGGTVGTDCWDFSPQGHLVRGKTISIGRHKMDLELNIFTQRGYTLCKDVYAILPKEVIAVVHPLFPSQRRTSCPKIYTPPRYTRENLHVPYPLPRNLLQVARLRRSLASPCNVATDQRHFRQGRLSVPCPASGAQLTLFGVADCDSIGPESSIDIARR